MNWQLGITIVVLLISSSVFSFSPDEREFLQKLYAGDNYEEMKAEHLRLGNHVSAGLVNPCMRSYSVGLFSEFKLKDMQTVVVIEEVLIFLENSVYFKMPGFLICSPIIDGIQLPGTFLMIINVHTEEKDDHYRFAYWRVTGIENHDGKKTFTTFTALSIQGLLETYRNNFTEVTSFYNQHAQTDQKALCEKLLSEYEYRDRDGAFDLSPFNVQVQNGAIKLSTFSLQVHEDQQFEIPGVLECEVDYHGRCSATSHFVMSNDKDFIKWYRVYKGLNDKHFVFEKYLMKQDYITSIGRMIAMFGKN